MKEIREKPETDINFCYEAVIFTENSRVESEDAPTEPEQSLNATSLFSLFTADIIKEEILFTR